MSRHKGSSKEIAAFERSSSDSDSDYPHVEVGNLVKHLEDDDDEEMDEPGEAALMISKIGNVTDTANYVGLNNIPGRSPPVGHLSKAPKNVPIVRPPPPAKAMCELMNTPGTSRDDPLHRVASVRHSPAKPTQNSRAPLVDRRNVMNPNRPSPVYSKNSIPPLLEIQPPPLESSPPLTPPISPPLILLPLASNPNIPQIEEAIIKSLQIEEQKRRRTTANSTRGKFDNERNKSLSKMFKTKPSKSVLQNCWHYRLKKRPLPCFACPSSQPRFCERSAYEQFLAHITSHASSHCFCTHCNVFFPSFLTLKAHFFRENVNFINERIQQSVEQAERWTTLYCLFARKGILSNEDIFPVMKWCKTCQLTQADPKKKAPAKGRALKINLEAKDFFEHLLHHMIYFRYICLICAQTRQKDCSQFGRELFDVYRDITVSFPNYRFSIEEHIAKHHPDYEFLAPDTIIFERFMNVGFIEKGLRLISARTNFNRRPELRTYQKREVDFILKQTKDLKDELVPRHISELIQMPEVDPDQDESSLDKDRKEYIWKTWFQESIDRMEPFRKTFQRDTCVPLTDLSEIDDMGSFNLMYNPMLDKGIENQKELVHAYAEFNQRCQRTLMVDSPETDRPPSDAEPMNVDDEDPSSSESQNLISRQVEDIVENLKVLE